MKDSLTYKSRSGKPSKALYFARKSLGLLVPDALYRRRLRHKLLQARLRPDYAYMAERAAYYCRVADGWRMPAADKAERTRSYLNYTGRTGDFGFKTFHTAYFFDQHDVTRWFPKSLRWHFSPGDVYFTPAAPTVVKSRLLTPDNTNSVLLKLDKLRHFLFIRDTKSFSEKQTRVIFRGKIRESRLRTRFLERFFGNPMFDVGVVGRNEGCPDAWMAGKKTLREHLDYKFIVALEGNDVASNLKWVMSSNSLALMTRPTCETWFMEGRLQPGVHYVEVKDDFSDVEEKVAYYAAHPEEAERILRNAHEYVAQFFDAERERLIQLMVLQRYFETSGQLPPLPPQAPHAR